jgi:proteasome accessory factor A
VSSATTRSRPIINTRDEPTPTPSATGAHVIVGDSNMSEYTTFLKVGATVDPAAHARGPVRSCCADMSLENPIRAIREISHDLTCKRTVRLANGREASALDIQASTSSGPSATPRPRACPTSRAGARMWEHCLTAWPTTPVSSTESRLGHQAQADRGVLRQARPAAVAPQVSLIDLQYHDVNRERGLFYKLQERGWSSAVTTDEAIDEAVETPPQTTRARLRASSSAGQGAQARLHGRLGAPEAQRPGPAHRALQGPVPARDERVERLIASL